MRAVVSAVLLLVAAVAGGVDIDPSQLRTFSAMGKELPLLEPGREVELWSRPGRGCLTHMWFALDERSRLRIYVDGEATPSIDMALDLGHGYAFGGPREPWSCSKMGRLGGQFNNYPVPYGNGVRVTVVPSTAKLDGVTGNKVWWILRGTENLPVTVAGVRLPDTARLRLHRLEGHRAQPLEEFALCDVAGSGALYQVFMAVEGERHRGDWTDLGHLEGCLRAYLNGRTEPEMLSSGLEDYFLGSGYFWHDKTYYGEVAGLTYLDKAANRFAAYRFHDTDPVWFQTGLRLTQRCVEAIGGRTFHDPGPATFTTYCWAYQW